MSLATAFSTARGREWLDRCDPRLKLAWLLWVSSLSVLLDSPLALAALFGCAVLPVLGIRMRAAGWWSVAVLLALVVWGTLLSQGLFYDGWPRTTLATLLPARDVGSWQFPGLRLYREGVWHGLVQSLRMLSMTLAGLSVALTTSPDRLLAALVRLRVPVAIGFVTVTALRFLPNMIAELATVRQAQRLRGARRGWSGWPALFLPVLASALRRSTALAASVSSRGFDPAARRTFYPELRFRWADKLLQFCLLVTLCVVTVVKALYWLYVADMYYVSALRHLYEFTRLWL